ncbi:cysteine-rich CWC family protein [Moraxellaceae bacterium AER2_44_116]|nr:hypothetical protein [Moraxellaceae bacterium]TQC97782.1 cysteine-rich CWC family protein [Moraxellaceae bacterium AER2_44_116]
MTATKCSLCGDAFVCGSHNSQPCWCSLLPAIMPITEGQDCYCPVCLKAVIREEVTSFLQNNPVKIAIPSQYYTKELVQDIDYYLENGNFIFTEWYHRKRGSCCGNGCRHCPYSHENVR